jgi:hypothetical protein
VVRTLLSDAFDVDFDLGREGHGFSRAENPPARQKPRRTGQPQVKIVPARNPATAVQPRSGRSDMLICLSDAEFGLEFIEIVPNLLESFLRPLEYISRQSYVCSNRVPQDETALANPVE